MMIYANTATGPDAINATVTSGLPTPAMVSVATAGDTPPELVKEAAFRQRAIAVDVDGQTLRLWDDTSLRLDVLRQEFEVEGWGIRMKVNEAIELPREMARQFLRLWSRSERGQFQEGDQEYWEQIVDLVDFQAFCNERTEYRYVEGELIERTQEGARVKWPDGREEILRGTLGQALDMLDPGEIFSASAKLNRTGRAQAITNCTILGAAEELLQEVDDDWIQKV